MSQTANLTTTTLRAEGFSCPSCVSKIEKRLAKLDGVEGATVHFSTARIAVSYDAERISIAQIIKEIQAAGYHAQESAF